MGHRCGRLVHCITEHAAASEGVRSDLQRTDRTVELGRHIRPGRVHEGDQRRRKISEPVRDATDRPLPQEERHGTGHRERVRSAKKRGMELGTVNGHGAIRREAWDWAL